MEETGKNRTPDKLPTDEAATLMEVCDAHLHKVIEILEPEWLIAVGGFAEKRALAALDGSYRKNCIPVLLALPPIEGVPFSPTQHPDTHLPIHISAVVLSARCS